MAPTGTSPPRASGAVKRPAPETMTDDQGARALAAERSSLEERRRARLRALGVAEACVTTSELRPDAEGDSRDSAVLRIMQFNILAHAMADDGFCVRPVLKEWPLDHSSVPTTAGRVVDFSHMLDEMMAARGKEAEMAALKAKYDVDITQTNLSAIIDPEARNLQLQLLVLAYGRPDIIVLQEVDNFGSLSRAMLALGYASQLHGRGGPYRPAHCDGHGHQRCGAEVQAAFLRHWESAGHTFLPKLGSTALNLRLRQMNITDRLVSAAKEVGIEAAHIVSKETGQLKKSVFEGLRGGSAPLLERCGIDPCAVDDDGVAVFWRRDRLEATSMKAHCDLSALEVRFKDRASGNDVVVLGTHLASGDTPADEAGRLVKEVLPAEGLAACARHLRESAGGAGSGSGARAGFVLSLDANSHPQLRPSEGVQNVWEALRAVAGASVWDDHFDERGNERRQGKGLEAPVTSNKLRGFGSDQMRKIGGHAYHLIDHVFFDPKAFQVARHVYTPKCYESSRSGLQDLQPSLRNPSDHFPVIVDLRWH